MVAGKDVCLRRLAKGNRAREVRFNRFLGNAKVTTAGVIESWSAGTAAAAEGRHILAIQDTSEINFATTAKRRRGLGEIGKGNGRGVLLHPMLAVDAENGSCLGLLSGQVWTRKGRRSVSHDLRDLSDKESQRWIATALAAKPLLAKAATVTALGDRESDIFALYASAAEQRFHVIARRMHDRTLADDVGLYAASEGMAVVDQRAIVLPARAQRTERVALLGLRFGAANLARPRTRFLRHLPESLPLSLVDVREIDPQAGTEPLHWRLLTTHPVTNAEEAWRIVEWYKRRRLNGNVLPRPQDERIQPRRQPDRHRRPAPQAGRDRRQGGSHHPPTLAGARWPWPSARPACLRCRRDRNAQSPQPKARR